MEDFKKYEYGMPMWAAVSDGVATVNIAGCVDVRPVSKQDGKYVEVRLEFNLYDITAAICDSLSFPDASEFDRFVSGADPTGRANLWRFRDYLEQRTRAMINHIAETTHGFEVAAVRLYLVG